MNKKLLSIILVLVMVVCVVASCGKKVDQDLEDAKTFLQQSYKNEDSKTKTATANTYTLMPSVRVEDAVFNIDWSIKETDLKNVKFEVVEDKPTVVILNNESETREDYTLVGKLTSQDGKTTVSVEFERYYPAFKPVTFEEWVAQIDTGVAVTVKGHIIGNVYANDPSSGSSSKGCLYIQDDEGYGYYVYSPKYPEGDVYTDYQVGDEIYVNGLPTNYNGQYEFKAGCTVRRADGEKINYSDLKVRNATADFAKAVNNKDTKLAEYQNTLVQLDNCLLTRTASGGYYYFALGNSEFNIYYNTYFLTKAELKAFEDAFAAGKSCTITGLVSVYSGAYQIYITQADVISNISDPTLSDQEYVDLARRIGECEEEITKYPFELQKSMISGKVAISWSVKEGFEKYCTIEDGKLSATAELTEKTVVTLTATYSCGEAEAKSRSFDVTLVPKPTTIDWISAKTAIELCGQLDGPSKEKSADAYYIYGVVVDDPTADYCNFSFQFGDQTILVYGLYTNDGTQRYGTKRDIAELPIKKGDLVYLNGKLQNYNGKLEIIDAKLQVAGADIGNPMDAAKAIELCGKLDAASKETSAEKYYILATIIDDPTADYCNFNFQVGEDKIIVYGLYTFDGTQRYGTKRDIAELPVKKGDTVLLYGNLQNYNGKLEITNARLMNAGSSVAYALDAAQAIELCGKLDAASKETSASKYFIKATIIDDPTADYCNFNFQAGEDKIVVYGLYTFDGAQRFGTKRDIAELPVKNGDTVILYGNLQNYNGKFEITNARLVDVELAKIPE